jgi:hypothetical protein
MLRLYAWLIALYPTSFRLDFGSEMRSVFHEKLLDLRETSKWSVWRAAVTELMDFPGAVFMEYVYSFKKILGRVLMSSTEDKSWKIENRREAVIASLPATVFGVGLAFGALITWKPWHELPTWRLWAGVACVLTSALIIALGGIVALLKRIPAWGYTWVGASAMGFVLFVKTMAEEQADFGLPLLSPAMDLLLAILILLGFATLIGFSAWQGWRHAGMVSLGFATMAGMSSFSMATAAPLNRSDLALLAAPVGLIMSLLTYLFVRRGDLGRVIAIVGFGLLNAVMLFIVAKAWDMPSVHAFPVVPFLVVLTGALLVGPIAGLIGRPVRKVVQGS